MESRPEGKCALYITLRVIARERHTSTWQFLFYGIFILAVICLCNPGCTRTCGVAQAGFELVVILLPQHLQ